MDRGREFTNPGTPWAGRTVFCLASGPSLGVMSDAEWEQIVAAQKHGAVVLAVNSSVKTARANGCEPDALIFTDTNWFEDNEALVRGFPGRVFTLSRFAKAAAADKLERIDNITRPDFSVGDGILRDGRSTGHRAVALAVLCGARRVVMLGYDMRVDPESNRSHCHDDYQHTEQPWAYAQEFVPAFRGWHRSALDVGCEIVNATPGSALAEFPMVELAEVLAVC